MTRLRRLLPLLVSLAFATPAVAQVGATTDILTGIVRDESGAPIPNAAIEVVSLETRVSRFGRSDARGRYTILFPDGGGQYRLIVRALGKEPREQVVTRRGEEDRLEVNVVLVAAAQQLEEVQVQGGGRVPPQRFELPTPGSVERTVASDQAARLPLDASDLSVLALLAPGVVAVEATDTSSAGFSVAGQRPGGNVITLDGTTFGASGIPQDAVRATRVITSTYDAARGQFSGGQVASTTRSGTNVVQGTVNYGLRDDQLAVQGGTADPFQSGYQQHQLSGGLGGPLVRNRLFFFGSFQARVRDDDLQSLLAASPATLSRLGASPDSVTRFEQIVGGFGIPVRSFERSTRDTDAFSGLARIDWLVSDAHTLTLRGDWRDNTTDPSRVSPLALPQTGGAQDSRGGGSQLSLASRFGTSLINEAKAYYSISDGASAPFISAPQGRVQVVSRLDDGSQGVSSLLFGGNPGLPQSSRSRTLELSNEVSWLSPQNGHRPKLGLLYNRTTTTQGSATNRYGTFTYNSLTDLEAGRPATFTRTLVPTEREGDATNAAVYLADTWRVSPAWQLTFGGRVEYSRAAGSQPYSPAVDSVFGRRTDGLPEELHISPRIGFTWSLGGNGSLFNVGGNAFNGGTTIRGGIGEFRSTISPQLLAAAQGPVGLNPTEVQLVCVGAGVPVPTWDRYYDDPATIPANCLGAGGPTFASRSPTLTLFNPDFGAPRSWRASLGVTRRIGLGSLSADLSWARGTRQTGASDLNLDPTARFTLDEEGGRPVFVPATGIVPQTGAVDFLRSRTSPRFGQVISLDADLVSETWQLSLAAGGITNKGIIYQASYTVARTRDVSSFGGGFGGFGGGTTAGNPNAREWGASDLDRRHTVVFSGTLPVSNQFELTTIARVSSGAPYTPRVGSDINGDGARNDRAFLFAPASAPDTAIGNGMSRLLAGAAGGARSCLESQLGRIAGRNSCRGPWEPALDLQLNWRPDVLGFKQKLIVSLVTVNLLNGVDRLVHGGDDLRGWGQTVRPDATLLYVTGFDPVAERFRYAVNERFGSVRNSATAVVAPFQVGIQLRYTIGPDRQREMLMMVRGGALRGGPGGPGAGAGPGAGGGTFFSRFATLIPNPARQVLEFRLGLNLDDAQAAKLAALADSIDARNKALGDQVQAEIAKAGSSPDPARLFGTIRPFLERGQAGAQADLKAVESVLTPEQWRQVPERVKTPGFRFGPGAGGPPGGARPPA